MIQEIHLGINVKLNIGNSCLEWRGIVALHSEIQTKVDTEHGGLAKNVTSWLEFGNAQAEFDQRLHLGAFSTLIDGEEWYESRTCDFDDALETFQRAKCSLPHDRIYGLRELIQWPQTLGPITPNYNLDPFEPA